MIPQYLPTFYLSITCHLTNTQGCLAVFNKNTKSEFIPHLHLISHYSSLDFYNWLFLNSLDVFQQADTGKQQSSKQTHEFPKTFTEPLIEIPISIEVEQTTTDSSETHADKIRKQNRQEFVTIQSIDETSISTHDDSGLPHTSKIKVGYIHGKEFMIL